MLSGLYCREYGVLGTRKLIGWWMTWMNAACKAAAIRLLDEALRPWRFGVGGCRHTQVTRCPLNAGACLGVQRL